MNDLNILKILKNIPDANNIATLDSPEFLGVPTTSTADIENSSNQIANTEFVVNKITNDLEPINIRLDNLDSRMNVFNDLDTDELYDELARQISEKIADDSINKLATKSIEFSYSTIEDRETSIINTVNFLIGILEGLPSDKQDQMNDYRVNLSNKRNDLSILYTTVYNEYNGAVEGTIKYSDFYKDFRQWYQDGDTLLLYCQEVLNKLNDYLIDYKLDNNIDSVYNALTDNGNMNALYFDDIVDQSTGKVNRKLFINGEYVNLRGVKVVDNNGNNTFTVDKNTGLITLSITSLQINGVSIESYIEDYMANSQAVNNAVEKGMEQSTKKIEDLDQRVKNVENTIVDNNDAVKDAIIGDVISETQSKTIETIYSDLYSRNESILRELNTASSINEISSENEIKLNDYKTSIISSFNNITKLYQKIKNKATNDDISNLNTEIDTWNDYVGKIRSCIYSSLNGITSDVSNKKLNNNKDDVFNTLTDNGNIKTLYKNSDKVFVDGDYVKFNSLGINNILKTESLYVDDVNCPKTLSKSTSFIRVYVNKDTGHDIIDFVDGAVYKTVQGALNMAPKFLEYDKYIRIQLQTDVYENIIIHSFFGGKIYLEMNYNNIYGTIKNINNTDIEICGVNKNVTLTENDIEKMPYIKPYQMNEEHQYYSTIYSGKTSYTKLKDIKVYGKIADLDNEYTIQSRNFAIMSAYNSCIECNNIAIVSSDCGYLAYKGGKIININTYGYTTKYAFYAIYGGSIDISRGTATGAPTNYTSYDNETINVSENARFENSQVKDNSNSNNNLLNTSILLTSTKECSLLETNITSAAESYYKVVTGIYQLNGNNEGFSSLAVWFFENQFNQLENKEINSIDISVDYEKLEDINTFIELRYHKAKTYKELPPIYNFKYGKFANSVDIETYVSDWSNVISIDNKYNNEIHIKLENNSENRDLFDAIKNGNAKGLCLLPKKYKSDDEISDKYLKDYTLKLISNMKIQVEYIGIQ